MNEKSETTNYCCGYRRLSQTNCDNRRHYNQDLIEGTVMEMMDELLLQEGYIKNQLHQQLEQGEKQKQESKAKIESRIDTSKLLVGIGNSSATSIHSLCPFQGLLSE